MIGGMTTWTCRTCQAQVPPERVEGVIAVDRGSAIHGAIAITGTRHMIAEGGLGRRSSARFARPLPGGFASRC